MRVEASQGKLSGASQGSRHPVTAFSRYRRDAAVDAVILQIRLPLSSETSSAPSGATVTPTGRPHC
jgi:hypothetical protein